MALYICEYCFYLHITFNIVVWVSNRHSTDDYKDLPARYNGSFKNCGC